MPNLGLKRGVVFSFLCHVLLLPNSLLPRALARLPCRNLLPLLYSLERGVG
jgi:hypothetical protein